MRRLTVLVLLCACKKQPVGSEFFGHEVKPPPQLAAVKLGTTLDQLKAQIPGIVEDPGHGYILPAVAPNIKLYALVLDNEVESIYVDILGRDGEAMLRKAWGPPDPEKDYHDTDDLVWRSKATGWRAKLHCWIDSTHGVPDQCEVTYHPHKPLAEFFAKAIAPPAPYSKLRIRMPEAEVSAALGGVPKPMASIDYDNVTAEVAVTGGKLFQLQFQMPAVAADLAAKAWGPAIHVDDHVSTWIDTATGWSASATKQNDTTFIEFWNIIPIASLLDQAEQLIGKSRSEVASMLEMGKDHGNLDLPVADLASDSIGHHTSVRFVVHGDKVDVAYVMLEYRPDSKAAMRAVFDARWGPSRIDPSDHNITIYQDRIDVLDEVDHSFGISISATKAKKK